MSIYYLKTTYDKISSNFPFPPVVFTKEKYIKEIEIDENRTKYLVHSQQAFEAFKEVLKETEHLKEYCYTQGDFSAGVFSELIALFSKILQDSNVKRSNLSFVYRDQKNKLCGFSISYLPFKDNPFCISIIRDVNQTIEKRQVFIFASQALDKRMKEYDKPNFSHFDPSIQSLIPADELRTQLKLALNSKEVEGLVLPLLAGEHVRPESFHRLNRRFDCGNYIDEKYHELSQTLMIWWLRLKATKDQPKLIEEIEKDIEQAYNENSYFSIKNQKNPLDIIKEKYQGRIEKLESVVNEDELRQQMLSIITDYYRALDDYTRLDVLAKDRRMTNILGACIALTICVAGILTLTGVFAPIGLTLAVGLASTIGTIGTVLAGLIGLELAADAWNTRFPSPPKPYQESWTELLEHSSQKKPELNSGL